jgi:hypothetical protein
MSLGEAERKRPLWRSKCRWEDNIKMGLKKGCEFVVPDKNRCRALTNTIIKLRVLKEGREFLDQLNDCHILKKDCVP